MDYGSFEGTIPHGKYGAGTVTIWDDGRYTLEKWHDDKIIVTVKGAPTDRWAVCGWHPHRRRPREVHLADAPDEDGCRWPAAA